MISQPFLPFGILASDCDSFGCGNVMDCLNYKLIRNIFSCPRGGAFSAISCPAWWRICGFLCTIKTDPYQEKMRGQRGSLPVQALGYVNSTKVILGLPEAAGVHFLLRPHHYILKVITQFRNGGPRTIVNQQRVVY